MRRTHTLALLLAVAFLLAGCRSGTTTPLVGLELDATVGTVAGVCATTDELTLADAAVHTVFYCYTITNTGELAIPLHDVTDEVNGSLLREFAFDLEPGASISTVAAGVTVSADLSETTTNTATWDGFVGSTRVASATASTTVTVIPPDTGLRLTATVGTEPGTCASATSIDLFDDVVPQTVYYCYSATNTGNVTLDLHDLVDSLNGVIFRDLAFDLAPGASIDTVAAGLTISADLAATTTNVATWDGFVGAERLAIGQASTTVTFVPRPAPRQYAAHAGTFVADSNGPTISPFAGNVVFLGIREFDGTPIAETVDVEVTVPGYDPFTYTFDPDLAEGGVLAFILADFTVELASVQARGLRYPVVTLPARAGVHANAVVSGTFSFAFPGQTLMVDVDPAGVLALPTVTDVIVENAGLDLNVTFDDHGDPAIGYVLEAFGRGPNAAFGSAAAASSPAVVGLSFPLDLDEPFAVGVLATRGPSLNPFSPPTSQVDAAEYLYYSPE